MVLTDFGLTRLAGAVRHTLTGASWGTPAYKSPDQVKGKPGDKYSDIYSLGVILFELVTGQVPFEAETPVALIVKHMNEPVPSPSRLNPDLPPAVEPVVLRALAKEPGDRYQSAGELAKAFARACRGKH
jgi:serine/threonine-protein kinase